LAPDVDRPRHEGRRHPLRLGPDDGAAPQALPRRRPLDARPRRRPRRLVEGLRRLRHLQLVPRPPESSVIAVVGAGAVGSYFGGMLARAGRPVTLVGRAAHVAAITRSGLRIESVGWDETVPVRATTDLGAVREARTVLVCVKTVDTQEVARALKPLLTPGALVVSLQNGVENVDVMRAA